MKVTKRLLLFSLQRHYTNAKLTRIAVFWRNVRKENAFAKETPSETGKTAEVNITIN